MGSQNMFGSWTRPSSFSTSIAQSRGSIPIQKSSQGLWTSRWLSRRSPWTENSQRRSPSTTPSECPSRLLRCSRQPLLRHRHRMCAGMIRARAVDGAGGGVTPRRPPLRRRMARRRLGGWCMHASTLGLLGPATRRRPLRARKPPDQSWLCPPRWTRKN